MPSPIKIKNIDIFPFRRNLHQPFRTALGDHNILENIIFAIELEDGPKGWGEAALAPHITGETYKDTLSNLQKMAEYLRDEDISHYLELGYELHYHLSDNKTALAAVEMALMDALTQMWGIPLWKFFGPKMSILKTDITIVIAGLEETMDSVKRFYRQGFRHFKVKIGRDFDLDIQRLLAIKRLAPRCAIYLDANQGYSAEETMKFLKEMEKLRIVIALIEQPVPRDDWEGLVRFTSHTKIPVCADESIRSLADALHAIKDKIPVVNVKLMKFGIFEAREISFAAKANGIELMMGGMMESNIAMTAAAHMAAGMGCFKYVDLDTPFFINEEVERNPYLSTKGVYNLKAVKSGIGLKINKP